MLPPNRLKNLFAHAKRVSALSKYRFQLGAVIFKGNRLISTGYNKNKTHPTAKKYYQHGSVHAEFDAVLHANESIDGASMLVCRVKKDGSPAMSKPCVMCTQIIFESGIKEVFWTTSELPFWDHACVKDLYKLIDKEKAFKENVFLNAK